MSNSIPDYKRRALERRRELLFKQFNAANDQLNQSIDAVNRPKLQLQIADLERQIDEIDVQLGKGASSKPPSEDAKSMPGYTPPANIPFGSGNRWAVLVGVNTYEDVNFYGSLQVCVKDVEATQSQLISCGYDPARIRLLTDDTAEKPTKANILSALQSVADATELDDFLLFYYSGHGDEVNGESFLVARDGRNLVLADTAVPITRIKQIIEAAPARGKVIFLDACQSGANIGSKGPRPMSLQFIQRVFAEAEGLAILASCKQEQVSYEWPERQQSVFTHYLLDALSGAADRDNKGFVTIQDVSRHVVNGVKLWASQHYVSQTPTLEYRVAGDIVVAQFVPHLPS